MQLGQVVGRVTAVIKDPKYESLTLVLLVALDEELRPVGEPFVAADPLGCAQEQIVYWESSLEARMAAPDPMTALDAAIVGLVDRLANQPSRESV
ncbi:MAG TPA: hypothetical protein DCZ72_00675 [Armatimonadetes bacterium]|nr:hypothetical protein [Armatimonadota bacterium]